MITITTLIIFVVFLVGLIIVYFIGTKVGSMNKEKYWLEQLPIHRKEAVTKSRAIIGGQFSEQLSPYLPNFEFNPTECKFLGKPVDFIVFKGMDEKNINEVIFVEVKSGKSKLNSYEKNLKNTIEKRKVRWVEYRVPEELTNGKNISAE